MMLLNIEKVMTAQQKKLMPRIEAAAIHLQNEARTNVGVAGRTVKYRHGKGGKITKELGARGSAASRPGEFPRKQFGNLQRSIQYDVRVEGDRIVARVGSALPYSKFLELGTRRMAARPWLRRTLKENEQAVRDIVAHGEVVSIKVG